VLLFIGNAANYIPVILDISPED